jgi:hypothetical protein
MQKFRMCFILSKYQFQLCLIKLFIVLGRAAKAVGYRSIFCFVTTSQKDAAAILTQIPKNS